LSQLLLREQVVARVAGEHDIGCDLYFGHKYISLTIWICRFAKLGHYLKNVVMREPQVAIIQKFSEYQGVN
jgi:hypothetical protein